MEDVVLIVFRVDDTEASPAVQALTASLGEVSAAMDETGASADDLDAQMQVLILSFEETGAAADDAAAGGLADFMDGMAGLVGPLTIAEGAILGIGAASAIMQTRYESSMSVVQALTGQTNGTMAQFNDQVLQMAQNLGSQPKDLADGLYYILSAGVSAKDAMGVLNVVTMASEAGFVDAKTDADALTTALNAYGKGASYAMQYQDMLLTAVKDGKTTMQELAGSIGRAAVTGNAANVSFNQVAAAISTMTLEGDTARMASMQLSFLLRQVGINVDGVAKSAHKMGLHFDEAKFKTLDLYGKLKYLWEITKGNKAELMKLTGGASGFLAASMLMTNGGANFVKILGDMKNSSGMTAAAFKVHEQTMGAVWDHFRATVSVALIEAGRALEPFAKAVMNDLMPHIKELGAWVKTHGQQTAIILGVLAAVIGVALVAALIAAAAAAVSFLAPFLPIVAGIAAVGAAVAGLVILFKHWWETNEGFRATVTAIGDAIRIYLAFALRVIHKELDFILPIIKQVASWIGGQLHQAVMTVGPVINQAATAIGQFAAQIGPRLTPILRQIGPYLHYLGRLIGPYLSNSLNMFRSIWTAVWPDVQAVLKMAWDVMKNVIKIAWDYISGFVKIGLDILGGNWKQAWADVGSTLKNAWRDMQTFSKQWMGDLINTIGTVLSGLPRLMETWAGHAIDGFIKGISDKLGAVGQAATGIAGQLAKFLHFTHPDAGPLADVETWMPHFGDLLSQGLRQQATRLQGPASSVASSVAGGSQSMLMGQMLTELRAMRGSLGSSGSGGAVPGAVGLGATLPNVMQQFGNVNFNGVTDLMALYRALTQIAGLAQENGARGALAGIA